MSATLIFVCITITYTAQNNELRNVYLRAVAPACRQAGIYIPKTYKIFQKVNIWNNIRAYISSKLLQSNVFFILGFISS